MNTNIVLKEQTDESKVIPIRHDELIRLELIMFYQGQVNQAVDVLKNRMKECGAWKDFRTAHWFLSRAMDRLYGTLDKKTLKHLYAMCKHSEISVHVKHVSHEPSATYVPNEDLEVLLHHAMQGKCELCLEEGKSAKRCELRKVFEYIMPPAERYDGVGMCPYQNGFIEGVK